VAAYRGMYDAIAAHSRLGFNVVVDALHHDAYSAPQEILTNCARQLQDMPVLFVGVRCPIDVALHRRRATWGGAGYTPSVSVSDPVGLWHEAVHNPGIYDLEVDTATLSSQECVDLIADRLNADPPPSAFRRLARAATAPGIPDS
jgi:chloramphenicol 3-O phosphotransferase